MNPHRITTSATVVILALALPASPRADDFLSSRDHSPVTGMFLAGSIDSDAAPIGEHAREFTWHSAVASHAASERGTGEFLFLDGETLSLELGYRHGIGGNWEVGIAVPWLRHSGGSLDRLIDDWHSVFSLPTGIRAQTDPDTIEFVYQAGAEDVLRLERSASGLGDVRVHATRSLAGGTHESPLLVRAELKLPTGDAATLNGSGGTDLQLMLQKQWRPTEDAHGWRASASLGATLNGSPDLAGLEVRPVTWIASAAGAWRFSDRLAVDAGLTAHGEIVDSGLDALGNALQLTLGMSWRTRGGWTLHAGFSEDLQVESYPDVVFRLDIGYRGMRARGY